MAFRMSLGLKSSLVLEIHQSNRAYVNIYISNNPQYAFALSGLSSKYQDIL